MAENTQLTEQEKAEQAAKETEQSKVSKKKKTVVLKEFNDKDDFSKVHKVGSDISHFEADRIKHLVNIGHAETK